MDSPKIVYKYYSNPAFCGQSEVVFAQKSPCVSSKICTPDRPRMPPLGANSPRKTIERNNHRTRTDISDNPLRIPPAGSSRYLKEEPPELPPKPAKFCHSRSNSNASMFERQGSTMSAKLHRTSARSSVRSRTRSQDLEMSQLKHRRHNEYERNAQSDDGLEDSRTSKHRYEIIEDFEDLADYSPTKKRIIQAHDDDIDEYNVDGPDEHEMKEIPTEIVKTVNGRTHRYAIVPTDEEELPPRRPKITFSSPPMSKKNLIATQKLHELLSTPRKLKSYASQPSVRMTPNKTGDSPRVHQGTPKKIVSSTPTGTSGVMPSRSCVNLHVMSRSPTSPISPRAQQKLSYGAAEENRTDVFVRSFREKSVDRSLEMDRSRHERSIEMDRSRESRRDYDRRVRESVRRDKTTAVITPRLALPTPSVYSEDTYKSWTSLKRFNAATASLALAALMMTLCGSLSAGLSFYIMYSIGRRYYLDFGVLSGFTCLLLGLLGFRSRRYQLLPNRNYISGYIVLTTFSLLSAAGLLMLLIVQPKPGTPQNDITSGAVCSLSVLSLVLASIGVLTSYCCRHPPPDNRVASTRWY